MSAHKAPRFVFFKVFLAPKCFRKDSYKKFELLYRIFSDLLVFIFIIQKMNQNTRSRESTLAKVYLGSLRILKDKIVLKIL